MSHREKALTGLFSKSRCPAKPLGYSVFDRATWGFQRFYDKDAGVADYLLNRVAKVAAADLLAVSGGAESRTAI